MADKVITGTSAGTCACCTPISGLECRITKKSGTDPTASLIGFSEFTSPSTPPKKYLTETGSGSLLACDVCNEEGSFVSRILDADGAISSYNAVTGSLTNLPLAQTRHNFTDAGCAADIVDDSFAVSDYDYYLGFYGFLSCVFMFSDTLSATVREIIGDGACYPYDNACFDTFATDDAGSLTGTLTVTLSVEDTEPNAIVRYLGAATVGSWALVDTDCSNPDCCLARYQQRTGFTFIYQEAEFRVSQSGLTPSTSYTAHVDIYRRTFGSGSYAHYATIDVTASTDGSGNFSITGDVPNDVGYETYAASATIT